MLTNVMLTTAELLEAHCQHREKGLSEGEIVQLLGLVDGWTLVDGKICKEFGFQDYYETLSFINAIAYVIHAEDHHPELNVTYNRCTVKFNTHSVDGGRGGISENDFICAAKIDAIFNQSFS